MQRLDSLSTQRVSSMNVQPVGSSSSNLVLHIQFFGVKEVATVKVATGRISFSGRGGGQRVSSMNVRPVSSSPDITRRMPLDDSSSDIAAFILQRDDSVCTLIQGSVLLFSRPRSEGWPHHGRTFPINPCPLSF